ncbi:MAG: hypothetical protein Q8K99_01985 [Actinomycetota bacterium]|nr:hypothetical protein [Actinomycetota bacterium]
MTRTVRTALTLAIAAALVVPTTVAVAAPRVLGSRTAATAAESVAATASAAGARMVAVAGQRGELIRERIRTALRRREGRFDNAIVAIERRITRIAGLADRVEGVGGDVAHVRELLDSARAALAEAKVLEAQAADEFAEVPNSSEPRSAFMGAKSTANGAVAKLREARAYTRDAGLELRDIVKALLESADDA